MRFFKVFKQMIFGLLFIGVVVKMGLMMSKQIDWIFIPYPIEITDNGDNSEIINKHIIPPPAKQNIDVKQIVEDSQKPDPGNQQQKLLILSYQRCGSSFFGDIFGKNQDVMYMYEPLDGLYTHMYGTMEGWNVPSDITNYGNGTPRILPPLEIDSVTELLDDILNCNIDDIPTTVLYNKFWELFHREHTSLSAFVNCGRFRGMFKSESCRVTHLDDICPAHFSPDNDVMFDCQKSLHEMRSNYPNESSSFVEYQKCLDRTRSFSKEKCEGRLKKKCDKSRFRAVKTVRATMESVQELIFRNPNLRVIHLIRDPRPVVLSRRKFKKSSFGEYSLLDDPDAIMDLAKEAKLYCSIVLRDIHKRRQLEKEYPGTIIEVIYEDFVKDVIGNSRKMYDFIDVDFTRKLQKKLDSNMKKKNSTKVAIGWQDSLSYKENLDIRENCKDLFNEMTYQWPF